MGKVVGISLIALVTLGLGFNWTSKNRPLNNKVKASSTCPNKMQFEEYVRGFPHNGVWIVDTNTPQDTYSCQITPSLREFDLCIPYGEYLRNMIYVVKGSSDYSDEE